MSDVWRGVCIAVCWNSMIQDIIGKEKYIQVLDITWVNTHWTMWALGILFFAFFVPFVNGWMKKKDLELQARHAELLMKLREYESAHS